MRRPWSRSGDLGKPVEWRDQVRRGRGRPALVLTMDRLGLTFQQALMYVIDQGAVIPMSPRSAVADVARF